jgi:phosphoadenosine phosphosulfate reductase
MDYIQQLNHVFKGKSLKVAFESLLALDLGRLAFSTSFGKEDQIITDLIFSNHYPIEVFTLDTGRLFEETYALYQATLEKYRQPIKAYFPNNAKVESLLKKQGPTGFYQSIEHREECCTIRKVDPLQRALKGVNVWITGLRSGQSYHRRHLDQFSYDTSFGLIKFNPLITWESSAVDRYLEVNNIPVNALHQKGFSSIGCAPCSRAIGIDEEERAGRWWWEKSKKECGLHLNKK